MLTKRILAYRADMNADEFLEALRADHETPFSRLGSSKALYALTGGEMDGERVRAAAAASERDLAAVLDDWTDEADGDAASLYADLASAVRDRAEEVGPASDVPGEAPSVSDELSSLDDTPDRMGGLLGRYLVTLKHVEQMVGFFVGDADPTTANDFRDVRSSLEAERDRVADALDATCESEADWDDAREAADAVVEAAYDHYVETLESMGIKPKNVC
jgi:hypothetical protein